MNAKYHAFIWVLETLMFFAVYSLLCFLSPDILLYDLYTEKFGFVTELEWSDNYTLLLFMISFVINTCIIYLLMRLKGTPAIKDTSR